MSDIKVLGYKFHNVIVFPSIIYRSNSKYIGEVIPIFERIYRSVLIYLESINKFNPNIIDGIEGIESVKNVRAFFQKIPEKGNGNDKSGFAIHIFCKEDYFLDEIKKSITKLKETDRFAYDSISDNTNNLDYHKSCYKEKATNNLNYIIASNGMKLRTSNKKKNLKRPYSEIEKNIGEILIVSDYIEFIGSYKSLKDYDKETINYEDVKISPKLINSYFKITYGYEIMMAQNYDVDIPQIDDDNVIVLDYLIALDSESKKPINIFVDTNVNKDFHLSEIYFKEIDLNRFDLSRFEQQRFPFQDGKELDYLNRLYKYQSSDNCTEKILLSNKSYLKRNEFIKKITELSKFKEKKENNSINTRCIITLMTIEGKEKFREIKNCLNSCETRGKRNYLVDSLLKDHKMESYKELKILMESHLSELHELLPTSHVANIEYKNSRKDDDGKIFFFKTKKTNHIENIIVGDEILKNEYISQIPTSVYLFIKTVDPLSNFIIWLSTTLNYFKAKYLSSIIIMYVSTLSIYTTLEGVKNNFLIVGSHSNMKSWAMKTVQEFTPEGSFCKWSKLPSGSSDFTNDHYKRNMITVYAEEMGQDMEKDQKGKDPSGKSFFKTVLTEGEANKQVLKFDKDGERNFLDYKVKKIMNIIGATNMSLDQLDANLLSRFIVLFMHESRNNAKSGMRSESTRERILPEFKADLLTNMKDLYFLSFLTLTAIKKEALSAPTMILTDIVLIKIEDYFKSKSIFLNESPRSYSQIKLIILILTIMNAIIKNCLVPGGDLYLKEFKYEEFFEKIENDLYATVQTIVTAVCLCFDTFQSKSQLDLINSIFEKKVKVSKILNDFERDILRISPASDNKQNKERIRMMEMEIDNVKKKNNENKEKKNDKNKEKENDKNNEKIGVTPEIEEYIKDDGGLGKSRNHYGFDEVYNSLPTKIPNSNYHLFALEKGYSPSNSKTSIFREVKVGNETFLDLHYISFKISDDNYSELFGNGSRNEDFKSVIEKYKETFFIPKNPLAFVSKADFNLKMGIFYSSELVTEGCKGQTKEDANEILKGCSVLKCKTKLNGCIFRKMKYKNKNFEFNKDYKEEFYDKHKGIPYIRVEPWDTHFDKKSKFIPNSTNINVNSDKQDGIKEKEKKFKQISIALELKRTDYQKTLEEAILSLSNKYTIEKDIMIFMLESDVYKKITIKPSEKELAIINDSYLPEDKKNITYAATNNKYDKLDRETIKKNFGEKKVTTVIGKVNSINDFFHKDSHLDKEKTFNYLDKSKYNNENITITEDLDIFAKKLHGETTCQEYSQFNNKETLQQEATKKYNKFYEDIKKVYEEENKEDKENKNKEDKNKDEKNKNIFKDIFERYEGKKMSVNLKILSEEINGKKNVDENFQSDEEEEEEESEEDEIEGVDTTQSNMESNMESNVGNDNSNTNANKTPYNFKTYPTNKLSEEILNQFKKIDLDEFPDE